MPNYPLLPPLKDGPDKAVADLPKTGIWQPVAAVALDHISRSLKVTNAAARFTDIDSIPSMWARPLLFETALYDIAHPMHECILGEWRGILAMLALKERRDFPLTTEPIEIPAPDGPKVPEFLQALRKLLPEHTLEEGTTWDQLYLILFNGNPIGMTSPTTLLCTSIDYLGYISVVDVPWFEPPFLCDPIARLDPEEKLAVAGWLDNFYQEQIVPLPADNPKLSPLLNDRIKFIKANLAERILDFTNDLGGIPKKPPKFAAKPLGMAKGLFAGMNFPIAAKQYFTKKLFVISQQNAFNNTLSPHGGSSLKVGGNAVTPILPIKKELLDEFSVSDLKQRITFEETPNGIEVTLHIPSPGDDSDICISREYIAQNDDKKPLFKRHEIIEIDRLPVLEIWPNFSTSDWTAYYTYFRQTGANIFYAEPFLAADGISNEPKITKTSAFPKAMLCAYKDDLTLNEEEAGILLIDFSSLGPPADATTWNIGIDFGTSGTTVYRCDPTNGNPQPMEFHDRLLQITNLSGADRNYVYEEFLSPRRETTPFFTLFQQHPQAKADGSLEPLLDGRIYFVENYKLGKNVVSNLKWSPDPQDRFRTQAFLEQICLQCAAEATHSGVNEINWHFSYPLAFSKEDEKQFRTICNRATAGCADITGITGTPTFESESIATAKFFAGKFKGFADGAICIDIGGETSDISIWQGNTPCWQTSIRFAGRAIFLDLLKHKPEFLGKFGVGAGDIQVLKGVAGSNDFYNQADTWINAWLNDNAKNSLEDKFAHYGGNIKGTPFIPLIALGISGLFYYVGLILKHLVKNKGFEPIKNKDFEPTMPNVYIGGNGSRILDWLANGNFTSDSESCTYLKEVICAASGFDLDDTFRLEITSDPKHEAAAGLIGDGMILKATENQFDTLAGEVFTEGGKDCDWTVGLTAEHFDNGLKAKSKLENIENFIGIFNDGLGKALGGPINPDTKLKRKLTSDLNDVLQTLALTPVGERIIEPLFIWVLKNLLKQETARWK